MQDAAPDRATPEAVLKGTNQSRMRDYNERLVLSLVRRQGALAKSDIARLTGLSAQTSSVIVRRLEKDGLLIRGEPVRGRVGQPSVPMSLNPEGLYSVGLNIGRRSCDLVLIDMAGAVHEQLKETYAFPTPDRVLAFLEGGYARLLRGRPRRQLERLAGIGIAAPFELWNWLDMVNAPKSDMLAWKDVDLRGRVAEITGLEVQLQNDATAACTAEHVFGRGREFADYAYFFLGSFAGGGVVLNGTVYPGRTGNAGAFGTLPVRPDAPGQSQLLHNASMYLLERRLEEASLDPRLIWRPDTDWDAFGPALTDWIDQTARHLAVAVVAVCSVIDFEAVLIDANCPAPVRRRIVAETDRAIDGLDTRGIARPQVAEAAVGRNARAIGAAALPILSGYLLSPPTFA